MYPRQKTKRERNISFVIDVARDFGITIPESQAMKHFRNIKSNLPKGTRDDAAEVYYAAKEYFTN